jgi:hypothetical protein
MDPSSAMASGSATAAGMSMSSSPARAGTPSGFPTLG